MSTDFNKLWNQLTSTDISSTSTYPFNINSLVEHVTNDTNLYPANIEDILQLKSTIETESRIKEIRTLRGKKRKISCRPYVTYSPQHILLGNDRT